MWDGNAGRLQTCACGAWCSFLYLTPDALCSGTNQSCRWQKIPVPRRPPSNLESVVTSCSLNIPSSQGSHASSRHIKRPRTTLARSLSDFSPLLLADRPALTDIPLLAWPGERESGSDPIRKSYRYSNRRYRRWGAEIFLDFQVQFA